MSSKHFTITLKDKLIGIAAIVLFIVVFILRLMVVHAHHPVLLCICDGFSITGLVYLLISVITFAISRGTFDGLFYVFRILANLFSSEKALGGKPRFISFYDFVKSQEHRPSRAKTFLLIGAVFLVISIILFIIYMLL